MLTYATVAAWILCAASSTLGAREQTFTPQRALDFVLDDELKLVSRFHGHDVGLMDWVCLFKNKHVLVRLNYCSKSGSGERAGGEVVGARIYSAKGEEIYIYAETSPQESVFHLQPTAYTRVVLDYKDLSKAMTKTKILDMNTATYVQYINAGKELQWRSYDVCFLSHYPFSVIPQQQGPVKVECPYSKPPFSNAWQESGEIFITSFPQTWFRFLQTAQTLVERHGE
ncbi:MAG: hypothetical protein A2289_07655 [Deltaproteobacteria bacterium RIFOXYA12_FULL_58_15]|nr:MAG: hypothetical protein A2289_07655 [Deltaproteobacteria bacterium RIFOXYA12_FULL_58_15]OGR10107.1 MAG: hypothetical protein A2341_21435 [Deltaproteobacteria bacterium RIFOXYB12_FULL_58_9]